MKECNFSIPEFITCLENLWVWTLPFLLLYPRPHWYFLYFLIKPGKSIARVNDLVQNCAAKDIAYCCLMDRVITL